MNRNIEFKVWCKGTSTNLNYNRTGWWNLGDIVLNKHYNISSILSGYPNEDFNKHFAIVQFTGMFDKNGVKIFEGDIVNGGCYNGSYKLGKIIYNNNAFIAVPIDDSEGVSEEFNQFEVIENIFEYDDNR